MAKGERVGPTVAVRTQVADLENLSPGVGETDTQSAEAAGTRSGTHSVEVGNRSVEAGNRFAGAENRFAEAGIPSAVGLVRLRLKILAAAVGIPSAEVGVHRQTQVRLVEDTAAAAVGTAVVAVAVGRLAASSDSSRALDCRRGGGRRNDVWELTCN